MGTHREVFGSRAVKPFDAHGFILADTIPIPEVFPV